MDKKKKQKFAASRRKKSGGSLHTKRKCQGNRYTKLANSNGMILSNEQVDNFLSASHKKIKSPSNNVANPTNINKNLPSPVAAATSDKNSQKRLQLPILFYQILKDIINCVGICRKYFEMSFFRNIKTGYISTETSKKA